MKVSSESSLPVKRPCLAFKSPFTSSLFVGVKVPIPMFSVAGLVVAEI